VVPCPPAAGVISNLRQKRRHITGLPKMSNETAWSSLQTVKTSRCGMRGALRKHLEGGFST